MTYPSTHRISFRKGFALSVIAASGIALTLGITGCASTPPPNIVESVKAQAEGETGPVVLREGDVVRITFPGAPNLNTVAAIRRDGVITLELLGEVPAAGMTPTDLQKELVKLYTPHLIDKEVNVTVESSSFPVFLTGAVLRPGKVVSNRPLSALEAIMEAGGFQHGRANLKSVRIIRNVDGRMVHYTVNLKKVLDGEETEPFYLKPSDIVYVPERFTWF